MAVDRPTFSESWYRVGQLTPRLRSMVQTYRQHYRGATWQVLRDPSNNQFFRVDDANYHFLGLLDGKRTVNQAWELTCEQNGDAAPTQGEAIQLLGQLYQSNLLDADFPADVTTMFERFRKRRQREFKGHLGNLLFIRIPLYDPDRLLNFLLPMFGWLFSPIGVMLWFILGIYALSQLAGNVGALWQQSSGILAPENLIYLYACSIFIKLLHETGHGIACKYFGTRKDELASGGTPGGEVHTFGIMFMVFIPLPYVDASSSWAFRNKWHRAFVAAGGMYIELAIAAVAAIIWANTTDELVTGLAYNIMFIAGFTTILFNANPLIKFDGYYILADLSETPNLQQRSKQYIYYLVKKYLYGVRNPMNPAHTLAERPWLSLYAVAAFLYRIVLTISILFMVLDTETFFFVGIIFAVSALIGWVAMPLGKWMHYIASHQELLRTRGRAMIITAVFFALIFIGVGMIPIPDRSRAQGIIESRTTSKVFAGADGFVMNTLPSDANIDSVDEAIVESSNFDLQLQYERLGAERNLYRAYYRQARNDDPAYAQTVLEQISAVDEQIVRVQEQLDDLQVKSPVQGVWVSPVDHRIQGAYIRRGEELGQVVDPNDLVIRIIADQALGPRLNGELAVGDSIELKVQNRPDHTFNATLLRKPEGGQRTLPSEALGYMAGGSIATDTQAQDPRATAETVFEFMLEIPQDWQSELSFELYPGQRVMARFELPPSPIAYQLWRYTRQIFQKRFQVAI